MALMRNGVANLNTEDPALIEQAKKDLQDLTSKTHAKIDINEYESLPAGRSWIHQSWSGDLLAAVVGGYLPKNTPPTVLSYWYQVQGGPVYNDIITVAEKATKPVMAHRFLNYMLDPKVAYQNFVGYVGYQPPITSIDPNALFTKGIIPKQLSNAVITRDAYANGNAYMGLTAKGDQLWTSSWASVRNG
jgi:spermidine/putrescine transport system substrate-binding protein